MKEGHGWTILFVRQDGLETHSLRMGRSKWLLAVAAILTAVGLLGVAAGRLWEDAAKSRRIAELEMEVATLAEERARIGELAARLEGIESSYLRIQRAMGGETAPSDRDIVLPPLASESRSPETVSQVDADPSRPVAWPLAQRGFVTRSYGTKAEAGEAVHAGVDIAIPLGSYVRASGAGEVVEAGEDPVYGLYIRIAHADGLYSLYGHNSWLFVTPGDSVERLEVIALSGSTGQSTAPHLHFEIESDGELVNPLTFVPMGG